MLAAIVMAAHFILVWQLFRSGTVAASLGENSRVVFASVIPTSPENPSLPKNVFPENETKPPQAKPPKAKQPRQKKAHPARHVARKSKVVATEKSPGTMTDAVLPPEAVAAKQEHLPQETARIDKEAAATDADDAQPAAPSTHPANQTAEKRPAASDEGGRASPFPVAISSLRFKRAQKPDYPEPARNRNESGLVSVLVIVNTGGGVEEAQVEESSGFELLDNAALKAARRSRFQPYSENGIPRTVITVIPYRFDLNDEK
jgi:protein TonB